MSLDKLYYALRKAKYPIPSRSELIRVLGDIKMTFEGNSLDAEEIAVHIPKYPLRSMADFFYNFLNEEKEIHDTKDAVLLGNFEERLEKSY